MRRLISRFAALAPLLASRFQPTSASIPQYVYDYAPLVWLHSQDPYRPGDLQAQLDNTIPKVNWTAIQNAPSPVTLDNLDQLNSLGNTSVYLTSHEGIDASPEPAWFRGITPDSQGRTGNGTGSAIIVVDHGSGNVDAFYFYFFAYNKGDKVLGLEFGDHIGDWYGAQHDPLRKRHPQAMWYSQHASGQAYTYEAMEKRGKRPISYSGNGTHANYATAGTHDHTLPGITLPVGFLLDYTDQGILWDPILNAYTYTYDPSTQVFAAATVEPVAWLNFNGRWGDDQPPNEPSIFGEAKYVAGPNGPKFKSLNRTHVCPSTPCIVLPFRLFAVNSTAP
ncbi:hypothetical protein N7462_001763 [Penicillium macrosclerotiorum]|uniref:uncharacterized protein n=1 Tax=Penicillium macrosclerotiorum TaxID=303699 RepID=UPI002547F16A|nr:uncharacterized protein N7462_001763 [Penicillium macrosclerotiorum]KAJ5692340.1 hypothetical protein N7462_001763 [Penicillium macrosclerotiorum]